jgi:hypothetical protein
VSQRFSFFHFPVDVFKHYDRKDSIFAVIRADGKVIEEDDKCVTNKITIIEQLTLEQLK